MKHFFSMVLSCFVYIMGVNLLFSGCGDIWFQPPDVVIDTLDSEVAKAPSTEIKNENWMTPGSKIDFNNTIGVSWGFTVSKYGNFCDCGKDVYYSTYTVSVSGSNDSSIFFDSAQKIGIPKIDSFFKVDEQPDLGSISPIPLIPQTNYPIFIDDGGKKVLFCANGSEHRVYYEPYGLIYSRSYSSCGTFCGHRYITILSKYNGSTFDYLGAIGIAKGLYDKWIQFQKSDNYTFIVPDSSAIKSITLDGSTLWSKGDPIVSKKPQISSTGQVWIRVQGITSLTEYPIMARAMDSLIVITAPVEGLKIIDRKFEQSFF
jgi:hypothetical protein